MYCLFKQVVFFVYNTSQDHRKQTATTWYSINYYIIKHVNRVSKRDNLTLVWIVNSRLCVLTGRSLHFRTSVRFAKRAYQFHPHLNSKISTSHLQISHHHLNHSPNPKITSTHTSIKSHKSNKNHISQQPKFLPNSHFNHL